MTRGEQSILRCAVCLALPSNVPGVTAAAVLATPDVVSYCCVILLIDIIIIIACFLLVLL